MRTLFVTPLLRSARPYRFDILITLAVFAVFAAFGQWSSLPALGYLMVLEFSVSFDNALVNAKVLVRMSPFWQIMFLTVGMFIAVGGMRFLFPIIIVATTAHMGFGEVVVVALNNPTLYAAKLGDAHPIIATFGGVYLMLLFFDFAFNAERELQWLRFIERPLARIGKLNDLKYILVGAYILWMILQGNPSHALSIAIAGISSLVLYAAVNAIADFFEVEDEENETKPARRGLAGLALFLFLEVQDSAFSFDGVAGAFAITDKVIVIAAGLGLSALYVRTMTVHFVKTHKLEQYRYLEHGAYWAIGALAICLLVEATGVEISEYVTGSFGALFIGSALIHSIVMNRRDAKEALGTASPVAPHLVEQ